jgi:hypothetical protein
MRGSVVFPTVYMKLWGEDCFAISFMTFFQFVVGECRAFRKIFGIILYISDQSGRLSLSVVNGKHFFNAGQVRLNKRRNGR